MRREILPSGKGGGGGGGKGPVHTNAFWKRVHFDVFRPSVYTNTLSVFIENASIWKTLLKVDQNENAYISYSFGHSY